MLRRQVLSLALWAGQCAGFGADLLQQERGPDMAALKNAIVNDISLPATAGNFSAFLETSSLEAFGLRERAIECVNPGWYLCKSGLGCCPPGSACFSNGCCEGSSEPCGSRGCYYKSSQTCCGDGTICPKGATCIGGGSCCSNGQIKCGSSGCYDPDESVCCGGIGRHCPKGYDCMEGGGCCPSGQKRCGNSKCYNPRTATCCEGDNTVWACPKGNSCCSGGYCADPQYRKCCEKGSCLKSATCCEEECCLDGAYCGSDGRCKSCPAATRTFSSTDTITTTKMRTVRVTTDIEPDTGDAPEFTCPPMSATNDEGETLELDEGCTLHYSAGSPTTTSDAADRLRRDAEAAPKTGEAPALLARQASCKATSTFTRTVWETETETETGTRTITVQGGQGTFSCPAMEVTNDVGDVLALDEECALSFSLAEPTSTESGEATARSTASAAAGGDSGSDNASSVNGVRVSTTMGVAGAVLLWLIL